ncbi:MAG: DUF1501 domain-containing protein [Puniceicoccaceae bacterium]
MLLNTSKTRFNRREFIKLGMMGGLGMQLGSSSFAQSLTPSARKPIARSVIEIWMWGGPSHIDTFDPKPEAGREIIGPYTDTVETNISGIRLNASMPKLAKLADRYSIIRSLTHGIRAHETATYMMQTGRAPGDGEVYPCVGAVVSKFLGHEANYKGIIPPYVVLTRSHGRFSEEGFLGPKFKPFATGGNPSASRFVVEGIVAEGIDDNRQVQRRELKNQLDQFGQHIQANPAFQKLDQCEEKAYDMILGEARDIFNLSLEPEELRQRYGMNHFGQSCLQARRLVEEGVPYITVNYNGWDTHKTHFTTMNQKMPEFDNAVSALLQDLSDRGLLENTIVWCSGEFGRTPRIQWEEPWNGGRGHFGACFSGFVAGGGFKGGQVIGKSNENGEEVVERPVYPQDLIGSIYELTGIDPEGTIRNGSGQQIPLTLPSDKGRLYEIM